ncbi:hypothetical protein CLAFUW4_10880 [Fulvia fulva]|uniref:Uncharacterized protein n=1 Tax=Passalora fulva TaxID=5499 RepID=A0A9Q8PDH0_PASFU|nr:uncharacterized protein CLAFUR5_09922 [Fulvia fulva]KAK4619300.1 hypothetical protein CLAFUR4_10885 [Fulvia fulva]KAK4621036.1 hypothetical protein CLAFUR0_10892 [Fulvia fulva]UJO20463.1 hypothetical protein CLAFUR5_09922 [Fulvia fulva]WPV16856.1 hypothetical protein CLAFUW4_10880 [Fulvia fulva]WPV32185.1 hypothetical protein CLAFUW7_10878 [Fulvia fulva]
MSATNLQALLRFLSQDAKVPLATAMAKIKGLQTANLDSTDKLAKAKPADLRPLFEDEKVTKQIIAAAKRVTKKRAAGDDTVAPPKKKQRNESLFSNEPVAPADLEKSLELPYSTLSELELSQTALFTNRAPLVLAFLVVLLKRTMPEQPLSSRLSLAQAYVSVTSRSRAVYLGIETGKCAEEEGFGEGQPVVNVGGKEIKVIRRWGYEWKQDDKSARLKAEAEVKSEDAPDDAEPTTTAEDVEEEKPALWALDLESLKKSNSDKQPATTSKIGNHSDLPVYTPQSARAYIMKAFDTAPADGEAPKKSSAGAKAAEKEQNSGKLLRALDLLYDAWADKLSAEELDQRTWSWYVKVRPSVDDGVAGWGGKNMLKLADILALRPEA